ncbi:polysaccharide pyruvyl transferase family protein [Glaciihabitans sp. dw_435]|uniref:polysaccharide pyruvyl transferase family protein n=1 Tax=Glaciihabitans sp. dw_435 TaxID=2720081 RepID=UPI001BD649C6|nr:polysaccharide pyruvyl transferase family protein [Glaciihabitans sp. dw_435]
MRLVLIGDVGADVDFHIGDEAMLESALVELRARVEASYTVVSASPGATAARYGVDAVLRIGFDPSIAGSRAARDIRLANVLAAAQGETARLAADDRAWAVIDTVADSDAVIIAGGGTLATKHSQHIYERAALAGIARIYDKPLVLTGQSFGPSLVTRDAELVAQILGGATLVGVREEFSAQTARDLGASASTLAHTVDDASFLEGSDTVAVLPSLELTAGQYSVVSFPDYAGVDTVETLGRELDALIAHVRSITGLPVVLVPHQGSLGGGGSTHDDAMIARLARTPGVVVAPVLPVRDVVTLTASAALSVSSRYHSTVFALAAGVPTVGVWFGLHTRRKIVGSLTNFGVEAWAVPSSLLHTDLADRLVEETWDRRADITAHLIEVAAVRKTESALWWDAVASTLTTGTAPALAPRSASATLAVSPVLAEEITDLSGWTSLVLEANVELTASLGEATDEVAVLAETATALEAEVASLQTSIEVAEGGVLVAPELASLQAENQALNWQIEALEQRMWERERLLAARAREAVALRRGVGVAKAETEKVRREVTSARTELKTARVESDVARRQVSNANLMAAQARGQVSELLGSTSWKLSMPLRFMRRPGPYLRKLLGR